MDKKFDITSTAIEKVIDLAKDFLGKLITPTVEETGLLLKDKVTMWRFNNQVKILVKAKQLCEKYNINPKTVSLKIICPLLDYAGLEEDEKLQEKWSNLLTNMVDSEQNIENHVFPYLLSQVSIDEYLTIETVYRMKVERVEKLKNELQVFLVEKPRIEADIRHQIFQLDQNIEDEKIIKQNTWEIQRKKWDKEKELKDIESKERTIRNNIKEPEYVPLDKLKEYEVSNIIRLGFVKTIPRHFAYVDKHKIKIEHDSEYIYLQDLDITIDALNDDLVLTELGELFICACNANKYKNST
jgi:Abortive infection alpha